jgi:hypothetical protein
MKLLSDPIQVVYVGRNLFRHVTALAPSKIFSVPKLFLSAIPVAWIVSLQSQHS